MSTGMSYWMTCVTSEIWVWGGIGAESRLVDGGPWDGASLAVAGCECQPGTHLRSTREPSTVPTYQYACTNPEGKHEFEVVQSFSDAPVSECPECGGPVRKVYGSIGVVFKGSGFYRTDSRSSASSSEAGSPSDGKKDGAKKDGGTKDAAPAAASSSSSSNGSSTSGSSSSSNSSAASS